MYSLAGALHANFRLPNASYQLFLRMTRLMTKSENEVYKAFSRAVFNVCLHNRDDHTKNFAYLMNQQHEWKLAPAFDLTFNTGFNGHHQINIEGESLQPTREHLLAVAKNAGLSVSKCSTIIDDILSATALISVLIEQYHIAPTTIRMMIEDITHNRQRLAK